MDDAAVLGALADRPHARRAGAQLVVDDDARADLEAGATRRAPPRAGFPRRTRPGRPRSRGPRRSARPLTCPPSPSTSVVACSSSTPMPDARRHARARRAETAVELPLHQPVGEVDDRHRDSRWFRPRAASSRAGRLRSPAAAACRSGGAAGSRARRSTVRITCDAVVLEPGDRGQQRRESRLPAPGRRTGSASSPVIRTSTPLRRRSSGPRCRSAVRCRFSRTSGRRAAGDRFRAATPGENVGEPDAVVREPRLAGR